MTELELYKFINDNGVEWHRHENEGKDDVIILPYIFELGDFDKLVSNYDTDEGIEVRLKNGYAAIWMRDICEYFGIDMNRVFSGNDG